MVEETTKENHEYPKYVDHPTEVVGKTVDGTPIPKRVVVKSKDDEDALGSEPKPKSKEKSTF